MNITTVWNTILIISLCLSILSLIASTSSKKRLSQKLSKIIFITFLLTYGVYLHWLQTNERITWATWFSTGLVAILVIASLLSTQMQIRVASWISCIPWGSLPIISNISDWHEHRKYQKSQKRLAAIAETLPPEQICYFHIRAMSIERLAAYYVWLEQETDGPMKARTYEETLKMMQDTITQFGDDMLTEFRRLALYGLEDLQKKRSSADNRISPSAEPHPI